MKRPEKREYYIVDKRILPNSIKSVIRVNDLVENSKMTKYDAIKKVGISRSTYYKYKEYIKPFFEGGKDKVFSIYVTLNDRPGVLSRVLELIAKESMNILTIIQNVPIDGTASATISVQTTENILRKIEGVLEKISELEGVRNLRIVGSD
ncbi:MAG: ACT domain-containing protein [Fusobacteriaceae bacterium]|jgi:chorismate mutase|nr:ACT domain-containing protein [Fusobacteriaceae bacterium]